ncbi:MAG: gamma-glutamylcyclotransferase [Acidobacteria bacterium]|nr:gamma-glutamylcyclotransferase [Acidobacteriota bacterium]MCB9399350.1 gamma-glutamylcyclotransferase [Acidobacteriota bacterium]
MNLFVYGTLQPGHSQFDAFFGADQRTEPAWIFGQVEQWAGYPLLQMNPKNVVSEASYSWHRDVKHFDAVGLAPEEPLESKVPGFLLRGALTNRNIVELDCYEDIQPPNFGVYRRWLTWCWRPDPVAVWVYAKICD